MIVKKLSEIEAFVAGDETILKEVLNPKMQKVDVNYSLAHAVVKPGQITLSHKLKSSETYFIISGQGEVCIDDEKRNVVKNDTIYIPPMASQCIKNTGDNDLVFLCICDPAWKKEDEQIGS